MYYNPNRKRVNDWLDDKRRPKGATKTNLALIREYNVCQKELGRNNVILFFLKNRMGMPEVAQMLASGIKQRDYIIAVRMDLKEYGVTEEWKKIFANDINGLHERCKYVFKIIGENLRMTELYPYFSAVGFERLVDFAVSYSQNNDGAADQLEEEIAAWNAEHQKEIAEYMESIAEEKANMERHRAKIKADEKAEKEARKLARKAATAEVREIKKNEKKYQQRKRRIDRSFERYYK